jgi:cyclopropane fatty-acyl-phospholipid synthase-like methyltransferase
MANDYYFRYADTFDRLQPLKIEMYEFYHEHALDFLPFEVHQGFRLLDLGSGTGTFFNSVIERYPNDECVAVEYSSEMLEFVKAKTHQSADRVELHQRDLNEGLPAGIGAFDIVSSFSTVHHLTDQNKLSLL